MKILNSILFSAVGFGLAYYFFVYRKKDQEEVIEAQVPSVKETLLEERPACLPQLKNPTIKKGDKGKEIIALKQFLNKTLNLNLPEDGLYDSETMKIVNEVFVNTYTLKDRKSGEVDSYFIKDMNTVIDKLNKI